MLLVSSVSKQNLTLLFLPWLCLFINIFFDLTFMITQPIHCSFQLRKFRALKPVSEQRENIFRPLKRPIIRIPFHIVMISCDQNYLCLCKLLKKIIHFFQLSQQRLSMKQVSSNQKQINLFLFALLNYFFKCIPNFFCSMSAISFSCVWICS